MRQSRWETLCISASNTVTDPPTSSIFLTVNFSLPSTRETFFLHRVNMHTDRGVPAATPELPIFGKLAITSNPPGQNWANFIRPRNVTVNGLPAAAIVPIDQVCCNTLRDWVGQLQLKPTTAYRAAFAVDQTGLSNGDQVLVTANLLFEIIDLN